MDSFEQARKGTPLTDEERADRHYENYGTRDLPPRGTGLRSKVQNGNQNNMAIWGIGGLLALLGIIILNKKGS